MAKRDIEVRGEGGFTLIELLISIVVVAVLTAIAIPAFIIVVASSQDSAAKQNLTSALAAQDMYATSQASIGQYTDGPGLSTAGLITLNPNKIQIAAGNGCFVAASLSDTGKIFYATNTNRNPTTTDPGTSCATLAAFPGVPDTSNILAYTIDTTAPSCGLAYSSPINTGVNATVDWGDGTSVQSSTSNYPTHTYAAQGVYNVKVTGGFAQFGGTASNSTQCTTKVTKWGQATGTTSTKQAFYNAQKLTSVVAPPPSVVDMSEMFENASAFNGPVSFTTTNVTDMSYMFYGTTSFNQPVNFDTSNVATFRGMFWASTTFNQTPEFNTAQALDMSNMFYGAYAFNSPVAFNSSQVTDFSNMFGLATVFNQSVTLDTSSADDLSSMFYAAEAFNQPVTFKTGTAWSMDSMFLDARAFNQDLTFDTSNVRHMASMFSYAASFNQPLSFSNTSNVFDMSNMFDHATVFNQNVKVWNVSNVMYSSNFRTASALSTANSPF